MPRSNGGPVKSDDELRKALSESQVFEVECDSKQHQVEVGVLEDTLDYLHISNAVDYGTLPASLRPTTGTFIRRKNELG